MNMLFTSFINVENLRIKARFLSVIPIVLSLILGWEKYFMKCKNTKLQQEPFSKQDRFENLFWVYNTCRQQQFLIIWHVATTWSVENKNVWDTLKLQKWFWTWSWVNIIKERWLPDSTWTLFLMEQLTTNQSLENSGKSLKKISLKRKRRKNKRKKPKKSDYLNRSS